MTRLEALKAKVLTAVANVEHNGNAIHLRFSPHYAECVAIFEGEHRHANAEAFALLWNNRTALLAIVEKAYAWKAGMKRYQGAADEWNCSFEEADEDALIDAVDAFEEGEDTCSRTGSPA